MKKVYEAPVMTAVELSADDIVRTSNLSYNDEGGYAQTVQFNIFR